MALHLRKTFLRIRLRLDGVCVINLVALKRGPVKQVTLKENVFNIYVFSSYGPATAMSAVRMNNNLRHYCFSFLIFLSQDFRKFTFLYITSS